MQINCKNGTQDQFDSCYLYSEESDGSKSSNCTGTLALFCKYSWVRNWNDVHALFSRVKNVLRQGQRSLIWGCSTSEACCVCSPRVCKYCRCCCRCWTAGPRWGWRCQTDPPSVACGVWSSLYRCQRTLPPNSTKLPARDTWTVVHISNIAGRITQTHRSSSG